MGENRIIERKLKSTKVRLFTVPCCSIILFSSEGMKKLDDGWPESVEEQSLLLLVWRHYIKDVL